MESKVVGFIGAGNMAYAIANGMVTSGVVKAENIIASAKTNTRLDTVWKELGTQTTLKNVEVVQKADIIFLSVKPHLIPGVLEQIKHDVLSYQLIVSIAAGITLSFMENKLKVKDFNLRIIRTMPNTPCLVRSGVTTFVCNGHCKPEDRTTLKTLMEGTGITEEIEERLMNTASSLTGCSVAWFYMMIEALSDGAVKNGIPRKLSYTLASKAVEGAAKMVLETGQHPGELKDAVTSPNGSTICGLYELEQSGMRGMFMKAIEASTKRNNELGKQS